MLKSALLAAIQQEIQRHDFSHFVENPPSIAEGGKGVVVPGCPACQKRLNTMSQFLDHLAYDAMPVLLDRLADQAGHEKVLASRAGAKKDLRQSPG
jgi:hypothetical protein